MSEAKNESSAESAYLKRLVSRQWWCERVVEVPEHFYDWYAPRWYLIVVAVAYSLMAGMFINGMWRLFNAC